MAKKKERKDDSKKKFEYSNEMYGIFFILSTILGICRYGVIGRLICSFAIFLVGTIYPILLLIVGALGIYLIAKRKMPNFFTAKLMGIYLLVLSLLVFLHIDYITKNNLEGPKILQETLDNLLISFKNTDAIANSGGGVLGALFAYIFVSLFSVEGTSIVVIGLSVLGVVLFTNVSIINYYDNIKNRILKLFKRKRKNKDEEEDSEKEEDDHKIVITSMSDLTHLNEHDKPNEGIQRQSTVSESVSNNQTNTNYNLPPLSLLKTPKNINNEDNVRGAKATSVLLENVLKDFEVNATIVECHIGPTVTQYELKLEQGTKVNTLLNIQREIALALSAKEIRIQAPIPGKNTIGIEVPNKVNSPVSFKEVTSVLPEVSTKTLLTVGLGKDIMGRVKYTEINTTPHLLIAGSTGSGKSVCINTIIASILMRTRPDQVKLVMVDPKKVELNMYNGIPHLLCPVVTDPKKASIALKNIVSEMEKRYLIFEQTRNKNIEDYNNYCEKNSNLQYQKLPYIVVIIDELADLMMIAAKDVEESIMRITQMARAAGIHLIVATQRPSTDVITGVVKANIPSRLSFAVSSSIDSRTILDMTGAEKLLGKGDMLYKPMGENIPIRIQGAYVSEDEIGAIVDFVSKEQTANYDETITMETRPNSSSNDYDSADEYDDPLYNEIVEFAIETGKISASLIQRKYRLGFNRAARIVDLLEERGIIGPQNGSKPREVLVKLKEED